MNNPGLAGSCRRNPDLQAAAWLAAARRDCVEPALPTAMNSLILNHMVEYRSSEASLDLAFAALADPTRRAIFARLAHGERRVSELAEPFDMSLNAVSKHIKTLERAGLIRRRRAGRDHYLSAQRGRFEQTAAWFEQHRRLWNARLDRLEAALHFDDETGET